jgi:hypothetical protein
VGIKALPIVAKKLIILKIFSFLFFKIIMTTTIAQLATLPVEDAVSAWLNNKTRQTTWPPLLWQRLGDVVGRAERFPRLDPRIQRAATYNDLI